MQISDRNNSDHRAANIINVAMGKTKPTHPRRSVAQSVRLKVLLTCKGRTRRGAGGGQALTDIVLLYPKRNAIHLWQYHKYLKCSTAPRMKHPYFVNMSYCGGAVDTLIHELFLFYDSLRLKNTGKNCKASRSQSQVAWLVCMRAVEICGVIHVKNRHKQIIIYKQPKDKTAQAFLATYY